MRTSLLYTITLSLSALFGGGCITILFIVVPFWQSLQPTHVMDWFTTFGPTVGITMLPMEIAPLILSVICWFHSKKVGAVNNAWMMICVINMVMLLSFFVYFLPVNLSFLNHSIREEQVQRELVRWELIHIVRTILSLLSAGLVISITIKFFLPVKAAASN